MRIVVALGGNALVERGERPDALLQRRHVHNAAATLARLAVDHQLVITHGNGPQVGTLAAESESDPALSEPFPLDTIGAETQGMIGYWLAQELHNAGVTRPIVSVVTQTLVGTDDPAFARPTKFIGPGYTRHRARTLARKHDWTVAEDAGAWRRVVASPEPLAIAELPAIRQLGYADAVVICAGGGGVPVAEDDDGHRHGIDAVVDKDLATALLAQEIGADAMLLLTDVRAVMRDFGTDRATAIDKIAVAQLRAMNFPEGLDGTQSAGMRPLRRSDRRSRCDRPVGRGRLGARRDEWHHSAARSLSHRRASTPRDLPD